MGVSALVPAAGLGTRLGAGPKAFLDLGGRALLEWSVAALAAVVDEVVVAVPPGHEARAEAILARMAAAARGRPDGAAIGAAGMGARLRAIVGGSTRQATVAALALAARHDLVVVHDAARPFLDEATLRRCLGAARATGAASVATPVQDTLIEVASGASVDREPLRAVQTPQAFARSLLLEAHEAAARAGTTATDDAGLVRLAGHAVALVPGGAHLFKVTTEADLLVARAYARSLADGDGAAAPDPATAGEAPLGGRRS